MKLPWKKSGQRLRAGAEADATVEKWMRIIYTRRCRFKDDTKPKQGVSAY